MKTIQPVTVWYNGQEVQATVLNAYAQNDNLINSATFQYQLFEQVNTPVPGPSTTGIVSVATNYLTMSGEAYANWDTNDYAYDWIAQQLNLTITGNYVPPTPVPPTPQTTTSTTTEAPVTTTSTTTKA